MQKWFDVKSLETFVDNVLQISIIQAQKRWKRSLNFWDKVLCFDVDRNDLANMVSLLQSHSLVCFDTGHSNMDHYCIITLFFTLPICSLDYLLVLLRAQNGGCYFCLTVFLDPSIQSLCVCVCVCNRNCSSNHHQKWRMGQFPFPSWARSPLAHLRTISQAPLSDPFSLLLALHCKNTKKANWSQVQRFVLWYRISIRESGLVFTHHFFCQRSGFEGGWKLLRWFEQCSNWPLVSRKASSPRRNKIKAIGSLTSPRPVWSKN